MKNINCQFRNDEIKNQLSLSEMELIIGGITRAERNAGCVSLGLAAGIAAGMNPLVGGLTTLGCMLITPFN